MNINDFKFYRKNNRYYFESELLEGQILKNRIEVVGMNITNGKYDHKTIYGLIGLFNDNIAAVLGAEKV